MFIPSFLNSVLIGPYNFENIFQFLWRKAIILGESNQLKPKLAYKFLSLYVDMLWFVTVEAVKEKSVSPTDIFNRWHQVPLRHHAGNCPSVLRLPSSLLCSLRLCAFVSYHLAFCHKKQENRYILSVVSNSISILINLENVYTNRHIIVKTSSILSNPQISK
jgi:hypothetical protein